MNNSLLYGLTVLIWGSTWLAINYQLGEVTPEASIVYRFALASGLLFVYCWFKKLPLKFSAKQHLQLFIFGICLFACNYFFLYNAQQHINSALACIAFSTLMFMNIFNARIFYGTKVNTRVYVGGLLGILGIVTLFWPEVSELSFEDATIYGLMLCLCGTLSASFGNMMSLKNQKDGFPITQANAWAMGYGTLFMSAVLLLQGKTFNFSYEPSYLISLVYLSLFGSVIAFACYLTLLGKIGAHKASYANIMFPAVAVVLATIFEGFEWSLLTAAGFIAIMLGNYVVLAPPRAGKH